MSDAFRNVPAHIRISGIIRDQLAHDHDVRNVALEGLDLSACRKILDIGCGFGFFTAGLAGRMGPGAEITGIEQYEDYREPYLKAARKAGLKGRFIPDGIAVLENIEENAFDLVICSYSLYFFPEIIPNISRILKNDGTFVIITHNMPHIKELTDIVKEILYSENTTNRVLLPYEILINRFCDTNGEALLSPFFGSISRKDFPNKLLFDRSTLPEFEAFIRFKIPLFLPSGKGDGEKLTGSILRSVKDLILRDGSFRISKNDTIFVCSKPLKAMTKPRKRQYCPFCSHPLRIMAEGDVMRDYCERCNRYFYDNPLPVASAIVLKDRNILLVKRKYDPKKGGWCLPMGFAETGESIEAAALRELHEETGIRGNIMGLVDVTSDYSEMYGDLIHITYEAEITGGKLIAGDDASEVGFFPFSEMPGLAFSSNKKAIAAFLRSKQDHWTIIDAFAKTAHLSEVIGEEYLSDKLVRFIEENAETIGQRWLADVKTNKTTRTYGISDEKRTYDRTMKVISQFSKWLGGEYGDQQIRDFYKDLGRTRKAEGFLLSEVLSALSLIRKHIWEFALSNQVYARTIDIYVSLELERRMILFFDRAAFYVARGYEGKT
ncbi:MAG: NUDIX domain-containing protein [Bacteroidales bacterium]